ncbi:hypothetical protein [Polyangium jinanense]|uniref:Uncharacterized protein n=1 Tax=Polyangium jinanense TaxID=2829994 RepID=A0A9X4AVR0_9BACT|nr:hypothetical protein [Polyangium jinanense]MDC3959624.1 hypothetical protein [Polyangium jinanense]MDC3986528.1 hypothetical protein [Polyangium jinanense]
MTSPQRPLDRAPWNPEAVPEGPRSVRTSQPPAPPAPVSAFMPSFETSPPPAPFERTPPQSVINPVYAPSSPPGGPVSSGAPRRSLGGIAAVVRQLDRKHGAFFISRLILMTGINLRTYDAATPDDPHAVAKLARALRSLVPATELDGLLQLLPIQR